MRAPLEPSHPQVSIVVLSLQQHCVLVQEKGWSVCGARRADAALARSRSASEQGGAGWGCARDMVVKSMREKGEHAGVCRGQTLQTRWFWQTHCSISACNQSTVRPPCDLLGPPNPAGARRSWRWWAAAAATCHTWGACRCVRGWLDPLSSPADAQRQGRFQ